MTDDLLHEAGVATPIYTGTSSDAWVAGDYDGDGKWEPAVLNGWTWQSSKLAAPITYRPAGFPSAAPAYPTWPPFGQGPSNGVLPVPADYDGDGKTDPAYYSVVDGTWWLSTQPSPVSFGIPPTATGNLDWDVPVPADYDGDGKADVAIYRPTDSTFHVLPSSGGPEQVTQVGPSAGLPVPADYDGDHKADPAIASVDGTRWYRAGSIVPFQTFTVTDVDPPVPVPADYTGDGRADAALMHLSATATLEVAGLGVVASAGAPGYVNTPALPAGVLDNIVRLTFYDQCMHLAYWHTKYPTYCPPS